MLQLDGFPTGDGVQVKVFIHIYQSVLTPTQGCGLFFFILARLDSLCDS